MPRGIWAFARCRGKFILIVDGHCELDDRQYLTKLVAAFERSGADCIGRPQPQDVRSATGLQRAIAAARSSPLGHHPDSFIYSGREQFVPAHSVAVAYRRSVFDHVGLFDERFDACEDVELNHRIDQAGLRCLLSPDAMIRYEPRSTLGGLYRQLLRYGRGRVRLLRKHPDTLSLKTLAPAVAIAAGILGLLASLVWSWAGIACLVGATLYLLAIGVASLAAAPAVFPWPAPLWLPVVFVVIHVAAGTGELIELIRGLWRSTGDSANEG